MKTPADKAIAFLFVSHPTKDLGWRWNVRLSFPPGATAETVLTLSATDGNERPVEDGVFEFAGKMIPIVNGSGEMAYADFVAGKHETRLWMHRKGIPPIPGGLTFG